MFSASLDLNSKVGERRGGGGGEGRNEWIKLGVRCMDLLQNDYQSKYINRSSNLFYDTGGSGRVFGTDALV